MMHVENLTYFDEAKASAVLAKRLLNDYSE